MRIPSALLAKKIREVKGVVPSKTPMEVLYSLLVKDGYLIASNTEMTIMVNLEGIEGTSETFLLPPKAYNLLANMTGGDTEITADDNFTLKILNGKSKGFFASMDPALYSFDIQIGNDGINEAYIEAELLQSAISKCMYAVDEHSAGSPVYEAIYLEAKDGVLNVCGASHAKLAWNKVEYNGQLKMLLPVTAAKKLIALDLHGRVIIRENTKTVQFITDTCIFQSRLTDGNYLNFAQMFTDLDYFITVDRQDMIQVASRIQNLLQDEKVACRMSFQNDECQITCKSQAVAYAETMMLHDSIESPEPITVGLNPKFLVDTMKAFPGEEVKLNIKNPSMPIFFSSDESKLEAMILPVRLKA